MAVPDALKNDIQQAYSSWLSQRAFKPRRGQREMIAQVARTLSGEAPRVAVIEAGTGTGKTIGYTLPAAAVAASLGKTLVIATATVALQEQVAYRDLPDLLASSSLSFDMQLAKGRGRYVCLKRLDDSVSGAVSSGLAAGLTLFEEERIESGGADFEGLLKAFAEGRWNGEIDSWDDGIEQSDWRVISTDHRGCSNSRCTFFQQCPFFAARRGLENADVVVANHDLVLSDLSLGGGVVLPPPEECIYVFDEGHHLGDKTQRHFSARMRLAATQSWLDTAVGAIGTLAMRFDEPAELVKVAHRLGDQVGPIVSALERLASHAGGLAFQSRWDAKDNDAQSYRLPMGEVPPAIAEAALEAHAGLEPFVRSLDSVSEMLREVMDGSRSWQPAHEAEDYLGPVSQLASRGEAALGSLANYAGRVPGRHARWLHRDNADIELISAPLLPGDLLHEHLWSQAYGVIVTSATLCAGGSFGRFLKSVGAPEETATARIASPFDYAEIATLALPAMKTDPKDADGHTREIADRLPGLLAQEKSGLILFTSWRQLRGVRDQLGKATQKLISFQDQGSKQALIEAHRKAVRAGKVSYLAGVASFSEGLDLPDDECRHVIIAKIPFSVPDDPLDEAAAEWLESEGGNAFMEISLPDAAVRLVQACGRLIRHEEDHGRITLLDKRMTTARYGQYLIDSLPPFRLEVG